MESLSKSTRFYPERQEGFTKKGYHVYDLNLDIDEGEMIALNKKAEEYETFPIFNEEIDKTGKKTRIAPTATKYRFAVKRNNDDSCNDSSQQKYKPTSNKKHKSMDECEDSSSDIDSSDNDSSDDSSSDVEADDWFIFSKALDTKQPDDVVSENIPTKPRNNKWMNGMNGMNVKVKVEESVEVVEVVEETMTNISDCQPDDVVSENIPTKPRNNIWMNVKVKVEESVEVVEKTMTNISDCQPDNIVSEKFPTKPRNDIWMGKQYVTVKVEETVGGSMKQNFE